ncbi:hypothetical protein RhiirB3_451132 [Rhizophagus irregularis]|nr:hypothetical protein RhiirB3_451132 [Rhizophagus irregularis]
MESNEENGLQPNIDNEWNNIDNNNIEEIEEIEEKNIRGRRRGRGRGKDRGRGTGSSSGSSRGIDHNNEEEQIIQLPVPPFFNILHASL